MTDKTYHGSCHCQAVQFEALLDLDTTMVCNCSRCQRLGWVMAFTPRANLKIIQGDGVTHQYLFNHGKISHQFCPVCGIEPYAFASDPQGVDMAAVNVNCLDGVDPRSLGSKAIDGRSRT